MIFATLLPRGYVLGGVSVIQLNYGSRGDEPQYIVWPRKSIVYYVEDFDFVAYRRASPAERERILLSSVEAALCDVADRVGVDDAILRNTCTAVAECGFSYSVEIPKLRKTLRPSGNTLRVFRCLSSNVGEAWILRVMRRDGTVIAEFAMDKTPNHLDRRDYFKKAEMADDSYVVRDNLAHETFRLNVGKFSAESVA